MTTVFAAAAAAIPITITTTSRHLVSYGGLTYITTWMFYAVLYLFRAFGEINLGFLAGGDHIDRIR